MSTIYDTLTYNGTEKSFQAWGFAFDVTDELYNQKEDIFTATLLGKNLVTETNSPTFPFEAAIVVQTNRTSTTGNTNSFSGGSITFAGKRVENPTRATGQYQGVTYKFMGPWYDLANTDYQQTFRGSGGTNYLLSELVMNTSTAITSGQTMISLGDQIQAILQWLLDQYSAQGMAAPFQYVGRALDAGAINLNSTGGVYAYTVNSSTTTIEISLFSLFLPSYIAKPMKCSDAIEHCLKLIPRISCSFDYSTSPPTFHAALVDNMTPATLALFDGVSHKSLDIIARNDLVVRCVNINYRINSTLNGNTVVNYVQDKWGPNGSNSSLDPNTGLRVVNELVDLTGLSISFTTAHLDVEPVMALLASGSTNQAAMVQWWSEPRGGNASQLLDSRIRFQAVNPSPPPPVVQTYIPTATVTDTAQPTPNILSEADLIADGLCDVYGNLVLNKLVRGTAHSWMVRSDGQPVVTKKIHLSATMNYVQYDCQSSSGTPDTDVSGNVLQVFASRDHHCDIEVTNGVTGPYTTIASETPGEQYVIGAGGIAQYLYNHMSVLQYEGSHVKVEVVFGTGVTLRNSINFSGGATAWASMNAQPQSIRRHYGRKTTEVQIGVAKHLNSGQLSALLNMWRYRRTWYNTQLRTDNTQPSSNVDQAVTTGNGNTPGGLSNVQKQSYFVYSALPSGTTPGVIDAGFIIDPQRLIDHDNLN